MLPLKYQTIAPYLRERVRLHALYSGREYGGDLHDEHIIDRMEGIVSSFENPEMHQVYDFLRNVDYPDMDRHKVKGNRVLTDILLNDTFRQHNAINERYRYKLFNAEDLRRIYEPSTKYHIAMSRGFERYLVEFINRLDSEKINRATLKPI